MATGTHPSYKCDHEENRHKVCACCGRQVIFGKKSSVNKISEKLCELVKKYSNASFDLENPNFPTAICNSCRNALNEYKNGKFARHLPAMPNFQDIVLPKGTRSHDNEFNCFICLTRRSTSHQKRITGRGVVRNQTNEINEEKGLFGASTSTSLPPNEK